ncbi:MAG: ABC transporter ATP-binding protein [Anaerolineae bacterium]|nr:ABC transporter ATP-binding protein [Anaerolineae bacterium]
MNTPEAQFAVQTQSLSKTYRGHGNGRDHEKAQHNRGNAPVEALKELDLTVRPGEVFGLLGPNGAGKTTLVRILATLLRATEGRAWVGGYDVIQDEQEVRRIIGYAGQDSERSAYFRLTVYENLLYFAHALRGIPLRTARERIAEIADEVGFDDQLDTEFVALSGGQKQLVVVMRALLHRPRVVFMDEPSKSLDPLTAERVRTFLTGYARCHAMTILLTTHNMDEAERICDRLGFINQGRLQFVGTPREFRRSVSVQETVEVSGTDQDGLVQRLQQLPGVSHATHNGALRLYANDGFSLLRDVVSVLDRAGVKATVSMVEPSLEDAFSIFVNHDREVSNAK